MNSRDRLAYRGLLVVAVVLSIIGMVSAILGMWILAAICAGLWMIAGTGMVHAQTRLLNAGARSLRDSVARRSGVASGDSALRGRLDSISEDLAMVRARASSEPTQDEVRADLVQLAHSLRREVRLLQYFVTVSGEAAAVPASTRSTV